jgi:phage terminase large subunit GpA-like protein
MEDGGHLYAEFCQKGWTPDPDLTVSAWADQYRFLSSKGASEPGQWRTSRTPYLKEPMDCLSAGNPVQKVVLMFGAQTGKTEAGNNWIGYSMHLAPAPMLAVQPTVDMVKRLSKQRIAPMIDETPVLRDLVSKPRSRDASNTLQVKEFPGGILIMSGANSASSLSSMPVAKLFLDEVDRYPADVGNEGDTVMLAERRTNTFARRKILLTSTPTLKGLSRVESEYLATDQRQYFVPCPHCNEPIILKWAQMKWNKENPAEVWMECEHCQGHIEEHHKTSMLSAGQWRATAPQADIRVAGYHLSGLYSPVGWRSWADIVAEFIAAQNSSERLKSWVNTVLAETWEEEYSAALNTNNLATRCESYTPMTAPDPVCIVTAGVDVQDNRLAVVLRGWAKGEESWLIYHGEIYGDPALPAVWGQLISLLKTPIQHASGATLHPHLVGVDSGGHHTQQVYAFCRDYKRTLGAVAVKGQSQPGKPPVGKPARVDINHKGQSIKRGAELYPVGTDTIKVTIYARLKSATEEGQYHFYYGVDQEYFRQLTAEKQVIRYYKGRPKREWVKKSRDRNEALDCEVYAYAALHILYMHHNRTTIFDVFAKRLRPEPPTPPSSTPITPSPPRTVLPRQGFGAQQGSFASRILGR